MTLHIYLAACHYYGHVAAVRILILANCYGITNLLLQKFTFTENQTFLQNFYTTKIWSHTVAMMWLPALLVWAEYQPWQQLLLAITMATRQIPLTQVLANEYICKDQLFTLL